MVRGASSPPAQAHWNHRRHLQLRIFLVSTFCHTSVGWFTSSLSLSFSSSLSTNVLLRRAELWDAEWFDGERERRDDDEDLRRSKKKKMRVAVSDSNDQSSPLQEIRRFAAGEFQINRYLGGLGFLEITDWEYTDMQRGGSVKVNPLDPTTPTRTTTQSGTSVRLFEGFAYDGRRVLLKEFSPAARHLALNEVAALCRLQEAFQAQTSNLERNKISMSSFVTLKGCIECGDMFASKDFIKGWKRSFPEVAPPLPRNIWLVFKWEGLGNTVLKWPRVTQEWLALDAIMPRIRLQRRLRFVTATMKSSLEAVAFLHEASIVHRSLSGASLLLSTSDDRVSNPRVKISDFGFASTITEAATDPGVLTRARALGCANSAFDITAFVTGEDLYAVGLLFLEFYFSSLVAWETDERSRAISSDQATFQKLYSDVFDCDIIRFRDYCAEEPLWAEATSFLNDKGGSGWQLFDLLLSARKPKKSPAMTAASPFLEAPKFLPTSRLITARALTRSPFFDALAR